MARITCGKFNRKDWQEEQEEKNWTSLEERYSLVYSDTVFCYVFNAFRRIESLNQD